MYCYRNFSRSVLTFVLAIPALAMAAGAEVPVIAVSSQGTSNANSAEANDPSVIFYNPAGMARLRGKQVSQPFALIAASTRVKDTGTTRVQDMGQAPDTGPTADCSVYDCMNAANPDPSMPAVEPQPRGIFPAILPVAAFFASRQLNDDVTVGIGVFSPGGGNLNYKSTWFGRYFIDSAAIETVNINPSLSIRLDDKHSVGMGVSAVLGHAKFRKPIDVNKVAPYLFKSIINANAGLLEQVNGHLVGGLLPTGAVAPVLEQLAAIVPNAVKEALIPLFSGGGLPLPEQISSALDPVLSNTHFVDPGSTSSAKVETYGAGYGWNLGYMYQFSDSTRLGISYRSESAIRMKGELDWDFSNLKTGTLGGVVVGDVAELLETYYRPDTDARLVFTIPAKLNVGFFTSLTDKLDLMLNYTFNKTSVVKSLDIELPNQKTDTKQGPIRLAQNWRDSFTMAVGFNYHWNDKLTLRTGLQFDQTPVSGPANRHPGLADNDRWMTSLGLGYQWDKNTSIDLAYSYLYILPGDANYHERCTGTYYEDSSSQGPSECTADGGTFRARFYDSHAHILGLQLNKRF